MGESNCELGRLKHEDSCVIHFEALALKNSEYRYLNLKEDLVCPFVRRAQNTTHHKARRLGNKAPQSTQVITPVNRFHQAVAAGNGKP
eukprot:scaffold1047_cov116-Skeletonema_dohrnii-CCMP3373.AAC.3